MKSPKLDTNGATAALPVLEPAAPVEAATAAFMDTSKDSFGALSQSHWWTMSYQDRIEPNKLRFWNVASDMVIVLITCVEILPTYSAHDVVHVDRFLRKKR